MSTVQIEIPEEVLISLKETPETISRELRILAAVKLFELGKLSSGRAAQLAGMSRVEFLMLLVDLGGSWATIYRANLT
jgi:predicted HTH domain antitoxin